jgi:hypothetical protein
MAKLATWAVLESKPGKEYELEEFLKSARPLGERSDGTPDWHAIKLTPTQFAVVDATTSENGQTAHQASHIANRLFTRAKELLAKAPEVHEAER